MEAARLRVNAPQVIHETIDGEVIIINLGSGNYYSVKGCGSDVWDVLQQSAGIAPADLVTVLAPRFDHAAADVETHVMRFLGELQAEDLIVETEAAGDPGSSVPLSGANGHEGLQAFEPPVLEKYSDMQDLVLLDPVHEVDATGWPQPRPDASAAGANA
jgi:hypothetical protein